MVLKLYLDVDTKYISNLSSIFNENCFYNYIHIYNILDKYKLLDALNEEYKSDTLIFNNNREPINSLLDFKLEGKLHKRQMMKLFKQLNIYNQYHQILIKYMYGQIIFLNHLEN